MLTIIQTGTCDSITCDRWSRATPKRHRTALEPDPLFLARCVSENPQHCGSWMWVDISCLTNKGKPMTVTSEDVLSCKAERMGGVCVCVWRNESHQITPHAKKTCLRPVKASFVCKQQACCVFIYAAAYPLPFSPPTVNCLDSALLKSKECLDNGYPVSPPAPGCRPAHHRLLPLHLLNRSRLGRQRQETFLLNWQRLSGTTEL